MGWGGELDVETEREMIKIHPKNAQIYLPQTQIHAFKHAYTRLHSLPHPHTCTHDIPRFTITLSRSLARPLSFSLSFSLSLFLFPSHHTLSHSLTHTQTLSLTHSLCVERDYLADTHSLSLTHTHTLSLTHSHSHSLTHSHTLSLSHSLCEGRFAPLAAAAGALSSGGLNDLRFLVSASAFGV